MNLSLKHGWLSDMHICLDEIQNILIDRHKEPELFTGDWKKLPLLQKMLEAWAWEAEACNPPLLELQARETASGQTEAIELTDFSVEE
tara:strand:+ start:103 stop:366 length:264 start_codon:yes stop_codon:yes gene_type:complete